jgi:glycosyltransferase involved in cell wall biosynthesis
MPRPPVSVTIITLNEENNLPRAIRSVRWADEIVVVDSGSTDRTVELARELGAKVFTNPWQGYGKQKNFAQSRAAHDWVLNIDADEEVPPGLAREIETALTEVGAGTSNAAGFYFPRKTFYLGRWIRHGGWYPNHLVRLADRKAARWTEPAVHEELRVGGEVRGLGEALHHYTFSSIQDQIMTNLRFSKLGFQDLRKKGQAASLPRLVLKPVGKFLETYLVKRGFLDGMPGFIISVNAAHSMFLKYAYLIEAEIQSESPDA